MFETTTSRTRSLRAAVGRHAVAAGLSLALAAAVAGVGAGFAIAASANPSLSTAAVTAATTTAGATGNASTGAAARPIIRGLIALTARDRSDPGSGAHPAPPGRVAQPDRGQPCGGRGRERRRRRDVEGRSAGESAGKLSASQGSALEARADSRITQVMAAPGQRLLRALQRAAGKTSPSASPVATPEPASGA